MIGCNIDLPCLINCETKFNDPITDSNSLQDILSFSKVLLIFSIHLSRLVLDGP